MSTSITSGVKRVGTHNGIFHCDEVLGCFMIRLSKKFSDAQIVRTRDPKVLGTLDAVLDVGGVYDPSVDRYDHHQNGFEEIFGHGFITKLSTAGLVYKHFGKEIIAKELNVDEGHPDVHWCFIKVYKNFIEAIDGLDNGIDQYETELAPRYVNNTNLSYRVGKLNLDWTDPDQSSENENAAFEQAMALVGAEFLDVVKNHTRSRLPARLIVMEALEARLDVDPSGEIVVLKRVCPWILHMFELEEELRINPLIKYVIYKDNRSGIWKVQAMTVSKNSFECRKSLPSRWSGVNKSRLSTSASQCGGSIIGTTRTYEGALSMAKSALKTPTKW